MIRTTLNDRTWKSLVALLFIFGIFFLMLPESVYAAEEVTRKSGTNEYLISTDNGVWLGHAAHDFVNSNGEKIYCVQPSVASQDGAKTVRNAEEFLSKDKLTYIALGLEYINEHSGLDGYTKGALSQAWVWMNVNGEKGCFSDSSLDQMYSMRGASRDAQRTAVSEASSYATANASLFEGSGIYYDGGSSAQSQIKFSLSSRTGGLLVRKTGGTEEYRTLYPLTGATYGIFSDSSLAGSTLVTKVTVDENGYSRIVQLPIGTYYVVELTNGVPEGWMRDELVHEVTITNGLTTEVESVETPRSGFVRVVKVVEDEAFAEVYGIAGAVYGFYEEESCETEVVRVTVGEDGVSEEIELPVGTYYVKEVEAPYGYLLDEEVKVVAVEPAVHNEVKSVEAHLPSVVRIKKVDAAAGDGVHLAGAEFELWNAEGLLVYQWTMGEEPEVITLEHPGTYLVVETAAPEGYLLAKEPLEIEVRNIVEVQEFSFENVPIPEIVTTATFEDGEKEAVSAESMTILDHVNLNNLLSNRDYVIKGTLVSTEDAEVVYSMAEVAFTVTDGEGEVVVPFEVSGTELAGKEVTVFEELYLDGELVASHVDIENKDQTVKITEPQKPVTPKKTENPKVPNTGDDGNLHLYLIILACAILGAGTGAVVWKKRRF